MVCTTVAVEDDGGGEEPPPEEPTDGTESRTLLILAVAAIGVYLYSRE